MNLYYVCYMLSINNLLVQFNYCCLQILGSRTDTEAKIKSETEQKTVEMNKRMSENKEIALEHLVNLVCSIKPELHVNYRL
jgi:hypothetical protein